MSLRISRREFGWQAAAGMAASTTLSAWAEAQERLGQRKPRVAAINSIYRLRSHAYHIAGRFIHGYTINGQPHQPPYQLVRMFNDQTPADDLGRMTCEKYGVELAKSAEAALGGNTLDVDAVLLIIEHAVVARIGLWIDGRIVVAGDVAPT